MVCHTSVIESEMRSPLNCWQLLERYRELGQSPEQRVEPELRLQRQQPEQQQ